MTAAQAARVYRNLADLDKARAGSDNIGPAAAAAEAEPEFGLKRADNLSDRLEEHMAAEADTKAESETAVEAAATGSANEPGALLSTSWFPS